MSRKIKQDAADQPQTDVAPAVATDRADNAAATVAGTASNAGAATTDANGHAAAPAPEANGQKKEKEPKDARFQRLAVRRVNKALKVIGHVGNLASRQSYAYTDEQAVRVVNALVDAVNAVRDKFVGGSKPTGGWTL